MPRPQPIRRLIARPVTAALAAAICTALAAGVALAAAKPITAANAKAVATAISLRHSDLSTLKQEPNPITAQDRQNNAQLTACIGDTPASRALADVQSANFVGPAPDSLTISSEAQVQASTAVVARDLAAIHRPAALTCLQNALVKALATTAPKGSTYSVSTARLPATLRGTSGVAAVRVTAVFHLKQGSKTVSVPAYIDDIGFAYGQAEISLNVISTLQPPSAAVETRLAVLLVARARATIG